MPVRLRRLLLIVCFALLVAAPLAAQDATEAPAEPAPLTQWRCPADFSGETLSVYNWSLYIAEDTVQNFEIACNVIVLYDVYFSNEDLLATLEDGREFDVIVPSGYMIEAMIAADLLAPIDFANVPNFANISDDLKDPPYDPGSVYSVPYQWGTVGIAYRVDAVETPPQTWDDLFTHPGGVAWLEDPRAMLGIALRKLGYESNSEDPDAIEAAGDWLIEHGGNVTAIAAGDSQDILVDETADLVIDYPGNTFQLLAACACEDYAYIIPSDGANIWTDGMAIPANAPNPRLAEAWIDYILDPQVSADISNYTAYATPNQVSLDYALIAPDLLSNAGIYPPPDVRANLYFDRSVSERAQSVYTATWERVRAALDL